MRKFTIQDHEPDYEPEETEARSHRDAAIRYARSVYDQEDVDVGVDVTDEEGTKRSFHIRVRLEIDVEEEG